MRSVLRASELKVLQRLANRWQAGVVSVKPKSGEFRKLFAQTKGLQSFRDEAVKPFSLKTRTARITMLVPGGETERVFLVEYDKPTKVPHSGKLVEQIVVKHYRSASAGGLNEEFEKRHLGLLEKRQREIFQGQRVMKARGEPFATPIHVWRNPKNIGWIETAHGISWADLFGQAKTEREKDLLHRIMDDFEKKHPKHADFNKRNFVVDSKTGKVTYIDIVGG